MDLKHQRCCTEVLILKFNHMHILVQLPQIQNQLLLACRRRDNRQWTTHYWLLFHLQNATIFT